MKAHWNAGINTLDTADIYGPSERVVGQFVGQSGNNGALPAPVPCTKFCCFRFLFDIDRAEVKQRILQQCERLQVSKLPLVQFFWSDYDIKRYVLLRPSKIRQETHKGITACCFAPCCLVAFLLRVTSRVTPSHIEHFKCLFLCLFLLVISFSFLVFSIW